MEEVKLQLNEGQRHLLQSILNEKAMIEKREHDLLTFIFHSNAIDPVNVGDVKLENLQLSIFVKQ